MFDTTWEFNFLFTWCPKLLLLLPQPHNCFLSIFFAFHLSLPNFESRFDPYLSCLLLSLVSQIHSWGFNDHLSTCSFQSCGSHLTSCSGSPFHPQTYQVLNTALPFSGYFFKDLFALCLDFNGLNLLCHFTLFLFQD